MAVLQPTPATLAQNTYALDKLLADIKARVGVFLANEKALFDAKTRIDALVGATGLPGQVRANAQALRAKADSLLTIQKDAEASAQSLINRAGGLRTEMDTNPIYSFLKTPPKDWGLRQYQLIGDVLARTVAMLPEGAALTARLLKQNSDVKNFLGEVEGTERAATGSGALPAVRSLISSTVGETAAGLSKALWPLAIGLGAVALLWGAGSGMIGRRR